LCIFACVFKNDLILRAAQGQTIERYPVWLMRQAGRILPKYREIRSSLKGFKTLVQTPELAAQVSLEPLDMLEVDAVIMFSDILVVPQAMGCSYEVIEQKGPILPNTIQSEKDLNILAQTEFDIQDRIHYVFETIKLINKELDQKVPIIGFSGSPWTIFCYMIEGQGSKTFSKARRLIYTDPSLARKLLERITKVTIAYLKEQIRAGVHIIQVFDSWASVLPHELYLEFSLKYIKEIVEEITDVPTIVFAKGALESMEDIAKIDCNVVGMDWNMNPKKIRNFVGDNKTLQGNLDPCILYASEKTIQESTKKMLDSFESQRHIVNLGHGVYPDTDYRKVKTFIETVKNYSL